MPKFRKKPVVIEATQYGEWLSADECRALGMSFREGGSPLNPGGWGVETLEGFMRANQGDWIITGVAGERYPCADAIFQATYEPA